MTGVHDFPILMYTSHLDIRTKMDTPHLGGFRWIVGSHCQTPTHPRDSRREGPAKQFGVPGAGNLWVSR